MSPEPSKQLDSGLSGLRNASRNNAPALTRVEGYSPVLDPNAASL